MYKIKNLCFTGCSGLQKYGIIIVKKVYPI